MADQEELWDSDEDNSTQNNTSPFRTWPKTKALLFLCFILTMGCVVIYVVRLRTRYDTNNFESTSYPNNGARKYGNYGHETYGMKNEFRNPSGTVWPLPQTQSTITDDVLLISPETFKFEAMDKTCDIMEEAFQRYYSLIFYPPRRLKINTIDDNKMGSSGKNYSYLRALQVVLNNTCEVWPSIKMNEKYELQIGIDGFDTAVLQSESIWGILRGLETFSQLIYLNDNGQFQVKRTQIVDFPRFSHRGLLVDTGRHFIHKKILLENLEAMAQNKLNVFHWHIVDDTSFPYQSTSFPALSEKGSFNPQLYVYTPKDVSEILEFARLRGIRVIPEFDTPGHTMSWGKALPDLLVPCFNHGKQTGVYGPINPTLNTTYETLKTFFTEIRNVFPDEYVHLGADEVDLTCWNTNPQVSAFMKNMSLNGMQLKQYYVQQLLKVFPKNTSFIFWDDVYNQDVKLDADITIQVWRSDYRNLLKFATSKGHRAILSSCWYLDRTQGELGYFWDWDKLYACEPQDFSQNESLTRLVIGGEACMWSESVDSTNLMTRVWPRASAVAERLWSAKAVNSANAALPRFAEHRCRMLYRGIDCEPQPGPGHCNVDFLF